jgi:hypothetical protein
MNKKMMAMDDDDDVENVGIMQGLMDSMSEEDEGEGDDEGDDPEKMMERRPDTPEILMNNLRGDMRSVEARRDELADLVGYQAATETPETVLAMLQPVLAKQGGGGIGALPQSAPMAQGPQPPMMEGAPGAPPPGMPEVPTDMGMPPPGMPPLPTDAGMPPPPQQGGIAELMAGMGGGAGAPASDQPPIAMAKGGYDQNFNLGSDEEGVTPAAQAPSDSGAMMFPPEMVAAAQRQAMGTLNQQPSRAPSIEEATMSRLPLLNKMLGPDRNAMQAQMLFDLGQRAFGFAANTDETGKPLRGSFMSRLAGATRTLPAAMGKQLDQITQIDRQIKTLALQQGEKDVDKVAAQNAELEKRKGSLLNEVLRAQAKIEAKKIGGAATTAFGNSLDGRIMNSFVTLGPKVEDGTATPQEQQIFSLAKDKWLEPKMVPIMDPVTNMISGYREVRRELPQILTRGTAPSGQGVPPLPMGGGVTSAQSVPPLPMSQPGGPAGQPAEAEATPQISLWNDRYKISGPVSAAKDVISGIPGLGDPFSEITLARQGAKQQAERIVESLLKSTAGSVKEQEQLKGVIGIIPSATLDPDAYGTKLIALGSTLRSMISENEKQGSASSGLTPADKGKARQRASALAQQYDNLGLPPVVMSQEEIRLYPPGTEVLWLGKQLYRVSDRPRGNN